MKKLSIVKQLEKKYGNKWKYLPFHHIWTSDNDMFALYVHEEGYDINGNMIENNNTLFFNKIKPLRVYGNGINGERFYPES